MVTSRPLPHIERVLDRPGVVRLRLDPALLSPDVARYVDSRMATLDPPLSDDKNELVRQSICERANGLFLQARLLADNLAEGLRDGRITEEDLPDNLDRLPHTLRAVYEDMLKEHARRSGVTAEQQAKILMCVTHASRPLRLIELGSLLSRMLHVDLRRGKDLVRAGCGRLLELLEDETVSVIHHSFTEFLHDASRRDDGDAFPVLEAEASHAVLAVLLLEYLDGCPPPDATRADRSAAASRHPDFLRNEHERRMKILSDTRLNQPLVSYAANNLFFHIGKVPCGTSANQLLAALGRYLVPDRPAFQTLPYPKRPVPVLSSYNTLHLLTAVGNGASIPTYVVDYFVEKEPALLDSRDADGLTPLAYASMNGHAHLVELLLAKGADPTSGASDGMTPLHLAARHGQAAVVHLLLGAGVDPLIKACPGSRPWGDDADDYMGITEEEAEEQRGKAVFLAFKGGDPEVIKAFIPFIPPGEINLYLHLADTVENVKAILDTSQADVNCYISGLTKLYRAAQAKNPDLVKFLLQHGADPNQRRQIDTYECDDIEHHDRGPTPLHRLAGADDIMRIVRDSDKKPVAECIRLLVEAGADVNATMDAGSYRGEDLTPLHWAVQRNDDDVMPFTWRHPEDFLSELFLSAGANVHAKTKNGDTPLHLIELGSHRLLQTLVDHGADISALNAWGRTPLLEIIHRLSFFPWSPGQVANIKVLHGLLKLGSDVHLADKNGDTIFHHIFRKMPAFKPSKLMPLIRTLILAGADPNKRNEKGNPPLWKYALSNNEDEDVLRKLVDSGLDLNACDEEGRTVLWELLSQDEHHHLEIIQKFVRLGANMRKLTHDGKTLLYAMVGVRRSRMDELRYLSSVGASADTVDKNGNTIIHAVLSENEPREHAGEELQVLLQAGAPPLVRNARGQSALHVAGHVDMLEIALTTPAFSGLDVNEPDVDGFTPLHHAVTLGESAVWKLIKAGADPTVLTAGGLSPLHVAARDGRVGVLGLLLAQYRELNVLEKRVDLLGDGRSPIHYACRAGNPEAVWYLLSNGANARAKDEKGLTPLHALAEIEGPLERAGNIVGMLQLAGADLNAEAVVHGEDETRPRMLTALDMAVERKCWELVRRLIAHGVEPRDSHRHSEDFVLATDKEKLDDETRKARASVWALGPSDRNCRCRGNREDGKSKNGNGNEANKGLDDANKAEMLRLVLEDGDFNAIKEYGKLGGNILELGRYCDETLLDQLKQDHREFLTLLGTTCKLQRPSLYVVQMLVEELGVDVDANAVYAAGWYELKLSGATALHILACGVEFWHVEALEYLLSKRPYIEARNKMGMTPLLAAIHGDSPCGLWREETVRVLLRHGAHANAIMETTEDVWGGFSALEMSNHAGITKLLLENGASVKSCPGILTRAIREWMDPEIAKLLLDAGLDPNELPSLQGKPNKKAEVEPRYALHEAARPTTSHYPAFDFKSRQQAILDLILSHGADVYAPYPNGSFALQGIVEDRGRVNTFYIEVTPANCNRVGHRGRTLLTSACIPMMPVGPDLSLCYPPRPPRPRTVMAEMAHVLLNVGADPLIVDDEGRTPLHWLCTLPGMFEGIHRSAFAALTRDGPAALTMRDKQGRTPLHLALAAYADLSQGMPFAIEHLISAGADPTEPDPITGNSALHCIAPRLPGRSGAWVKPASTTAASLFRELVPRLDINARNAAGETPIFAFVAPAVSHFYDGRIQEALDLFIDLGADLQVVDGRRRTLLHAVAERGSSGGWDAENLFKRLMGLGVDPRAEDEGLRTAIDVAVARGLHKVVMLFAEEGKMEEAERQVTTDNESYSDESNSDESNGDSDSKDEDDLGFKLFYT
ncbi:ankyrin repeat-containing domain protein [Chaetomium tenue]|uniref:Ankyrin repeat-containing domain protein n=1 Tax=Chaetomium tenue TaxID=1854479 RepID=A0ACB7PMW7_9PEZI|nr:ankyrin repeat-containing domain protein [Chaetomium globosum]